MKRIGAIVMVPPNKWANFAQPNMTLCGPAWPNVAHHAPLVCMIRSGRV